MPSQVNKRLTQVAQWSEQNVPTCVPRESNYLDHLVGEVSEVLCISLRGAPSQYGCLSASRHRRAPLLSLKSSFHVSPKFVEDAFHHSDRLKSQKCALQMFPSWNVQGLLISILSRILSTSSFQKKRQAKQFHSDSAIFVVSTNKNNRCVTLCGY